MKINQALVSIALTCLIGLGTTSAMAGSSSTSGGLVLEQAVGTRSLGMGEAFVGIANDSSTLYWNAAGLTNVKGVQISATYLMGLAETTYEQILYTQNLEKNGGFGIGIIMLQGGAFELDDGSEVEAQNDLVIMGGYGYTLTKKLSVGASLKYYSSTLIDEYTATAFAGDLGLLLALDKDLSIGLSVQNIGTEIKYIDEGDSLPLTIRLGAGYKAAIADLHSTLFSVDLVKVNDADLNVHMGAEYVFNNITAVRLGYKTGYDLEGLTAGLGFSWNIFQLDYAFGLVQELDSTHKFTVSAKF
ncbi:PorV/PorQ family protein [bacterium]|nr:PorV/PorQ family protein [bacterium]